MKTFWFQIYAPEKEIMWHTIKDTYKNGGKKSIYYIDAFFPETNRKLQWQSPKSPTYKMSMYIIWQILR